MPTEVATAGLVGAATFDDITPVVATESPAAGRPKAKLLGLEEPTTTANDDEAKRKAAAKLSTIVAHGTRDAGTLLREAETLNTNGLQLVARGALLRARAEFFGAIRTVAAACEARTTGAISTNNVARIDAAFQA
ncbi:MAG: hypothetical protein QM775_22655 [Pirellulales bacterium]